MLNVSHILSVRDGLALGIPQARLDHEKNLITLCEECNLGQGPESFSPRIYRRLMDVADSKKREPE